MAPVVASQLDHLVGPDHVRDMVLAKLFPSSQKCAAQELGVSPSYLNDYLQGRREPGAKLLRGLGLERVVMYRRLKPHAK